MHIQALRANHTDDSGHVSFMTSTDIHTNASAAIIQALRANNTEDGDHLLSMTSKAMHINSDGYLH